ncbi:hypothetical protein LIER_16186 [Lithospermum erythrorhizon]|uniref:Uncharacterized protein n=1 Tax=Lithospermum erythrorhizon TaxID=34254 RepID=A0AAV3Q897_LITER
MTGDLNEDEMKKALEAGANTIEVPVTDADKTNLSELRPEELRKIAFNAKAVNLLHNAMCKEKYARIKSCKTAKEIWDLLENAHVGNNQVKKTKVRFLTKVYQKFEMKEGETIADMHQRFNEILNNLEALGKTFSNEEINGKIFEALTDDYDGKICAITDAKDIGTIPLVELIGSLKAEEEVIAYKKAKSKNKKSLAVVAAKTEKYWNWMRVTKMRTNWLC